MMSWCMQRQRGVCRSEALHARQDRICPWRKQLYRKKKSVISRSANDAEISRSVGRWWGPRMGKNELGPSVSVGLELEFNNATRRKCSRFFLEPSQCCFQYHLAPFFRFFIISYSSIHSFHSASITRTSFYALTFTLSSLYSYKQSLPEAQQHTLHTVLHQYGKVF